MDEIHKKGWSSPIKLGQILLHGGWLTYEELSEGLVYQKGSKSLIGEILVKKSYIRNRDLVFGLNLQSMLITATLTTALSLGFVTDGHKALAGEKAYHLSVGATVPLVSEISSLFQIPIIILSHSDIEKGYIDIQAATRVTIKNNNKAGYVLLFEGLCRPFKEVLIYGLAYDVQINSGASFVHQPYSQKIVTAQLSYRFFISEGADAGEYPWPLSLTVQPAL
ncbi:MAG: hypothetical protein JXA41_13700 [Deltaproteobacteria bacterium]|nr:hypothetical protein [Deltaproteobacteria bacterium]